MSNINVLLQTVKNLKTGKQLFIIDKTKRYAFMGLLEAYEIAYVKDGAFIHLKEFDIATIATKRPENTH